MKHLTIYWKTNETDVITKIRNRFGIPSYMSINGETKANIKDEDLPLLEETARRGFIQIRYKNTKEQKT